MKPNLWKPNAESLGELKKFYDDAQSGGTRMAVFYSRDWLKRLFRAVQTFTNLSNNDSLIAATQAGFALGYAAAKHDWDVPEFPSTDQPIALVPSVTASVNTTAVDDQLAPDAAMEPSELTIPPDALRPVHLSDSEYRIWARETHGITWRGMMSREKAEAWVAAQLQIESEPVAVNA